MYSVSVVIPVYLGEKMVVALAERLERVLQLIIPDYEIILINDASPDASWNRIKQLCRNNKRIKGIHLNRNCGQHAAISAGLKYTFGKKIVVMDCDLQDIPEDLPKLWEKSQEGYDIVMARRTQRKEAFFKRLISWCFHQVLSLKRQRKTDPAIANYAVYDRKVIDEYYSNHENRAFSVLNLKKNYSFTTVDAAQGISARGKSSYTLSKLFSLAFSLLFPEKKKNIEKPLYVIQETLNIALEDYDIKLNPLSGEKIELARQWRNDPDISQYMEYRQFITPEMQQKWFESVCNQNAYYFFIEYQKQDIGMINIKDIDYKKKLTEGGIFIYNKEFRNSDVAIRASLCLMDFLDEVLGLDEVSIHILKSNKRAIRYNKLLGYVLQPGQENVTNQEYRLKKGDYYKQRKYIKQLLT